ncbi:MAG: VWA domain-containing protein [Anaerolineae bacterium]
MGEQYQEGPPSSGQLLHNLVLFGRLLRALGLDVNPGRVIDLVQALDYVEIGRKADFYYTARCLLVHNCEDLPLFDHAFNLFWRKPAAEAVPFNPFTITRKTQESTPIITLPPLQDPEPSASGNDEGNGEEDTQEMIEVTRTYSQREVLRHKDFGELSQEEMESVRAFMAGMVWELGLRRTRRYRPGLGSRFDLRRSLRQNLRYGGELLEWPRRQPKCKPRPLVIIADISGSMERYSRLLLHFVYSLAKGLDQNVEVFVFSTRLTRITRQLRGRDIDTALDEVSLAVPDWAGGTRIGEALKTFNYDWGRRVLGRGAVVLLISDGWDRGDPDLLRHEIGRLQRSCHRLVWLNPLLGMARYEPLTQGMQAALPHIDDFLPVHNLASLEDLAAHLQQLTTGIRPLPRRQSGLQGAAFIGKR